MTSTIQVHSSHKNGLPLSPKSTRGKLTPSNHTIIANQRIVDSPLSETTIGNMAMSPNITPSQTLQTDSLQSKYNLISSPDGRSIQVSPEKPKIQSPQKASVKDSTTTSPIFRSDIRKEWIDAIFGTDFLSGEELKLTVPPRQGVGLAGVPSYLSYTATIEPNSASNSPVSKGGEAKVGVTLSRIPLGVYVRMVDIDSEAYAAGIIPGSILVDINGMGVLGEPSHKLLERLWFYEGHFQSYGVSGSAGKENLSDHAGDTGEGTRNSRDATGPVALKFIKNRMLYTAILFSAPPYGISWAPCANFALVQRTYGHAQKAGVRRGCLVAAVNDRSFREMDHLDTAIELKETFGRGEGIRIVCAYTPAASRSGFHDRGGTYRDNAPAKENLTPLSNLNSKINNSEIITDDGVRIRRVDASTKKLAMQNRNIKGYFHSDTESPVEYGMGSFFNCGGGSSYKPTFTPNDNMPKYRGIPSHNGTTQNNIISEIANRVAAGEIPAPTGMKRGLSFAVKKGSSNGNLPLSFAQLSSVAEVKGLVGETLPIVSTSVNSSVFHTPPSKKGTVGSSASSMFSLTPTALTTPRYSDCPQLEASEVLTRWDPLDALVFCLQMHKGGYTEEGFHEKGGVINVLSNGRTLSSLSISDTEENKISRYSESMNENSHIILHTADANIQILKAICNSNDLENPLFTYMIQFMALLSSKDLYEDTPHGIESSTFALDSLITTDESVKVNAKLKAEVICEEIVDMMLNMALLDDDFCQSLHFLLRSLSSYHAKKNATQETSYSPAKILITTHQKLRTKLLERDAKNSSGGTPFSDPVNLLDVGSTMSRSMSTFKFSNGVDSATLESLSIGDMNHSLSTSFSQNLSKDADENHPKCLGVEDEQIATGEKKGMSKKIIKMFRSRSKKGEKNISTIVSSSTSSSTSNALDTAESTLSMNASAKDNIESMMPSSPHKQSYPLTNKTASSSKTFNPRPRSILRKAEGHDPQDEEIIQNFDSLLFSHIPPMAALFENMGQFLSNLDSLCVNIERSLLKTFSQKITDWALQPWSASKDLALEEATVDMRNGLKLINNQNVANSSNSAKDDKCWSPVMNPMDSSELLLSVDPEECYILPSAHFPLLLTFNTVYKDDVARTMSQMENECTRNESDDILYQTRVEFIAIHGKVNSNGSEKKNQECAYVCHAAISGVIQETDRSTLEPYYGSTTHRWYKGNLLDFETRSAWGYPRTLGLRLSSVSFDESGTDQSILSDERSGQSWIDLSSIWDSTDFEKGGKSTVTCHAKVFPFDSYGDFDQQGELVDGPTPIPQLEIELKISTEILSINQRMNLAMEHGLQQQRMLLYKHDDDLNQEMLAIQFVNICDRILQASGLDLKIKKYGCISVGDKRGFIEWVPGTVSMSQICKSLGSAYVKGVDMQRKVDSGTSENHGGFDSKCQHSTDSSESTPEAFSRTGGWCKFESLRSLRQNGSSSKLGIGLAGNNPVQDFLRSTAYDEDGPYFIRKEVMDTYVKSCAGYSIITYLLGVGDRHADNLLLHPNGHFLHCDYSFILGQDPKTYLPMRITEHMLNGMGGRESDNFAMFLSLAGAAFVTLRQHASVRILLSLVRNMASSQIPDVSINQSPERALLSLRDRFRLDLNDDEAVIFIEEIIENSITSKMWIAVDAIHSLGKRF